MNILWQDNADYAVEDESRPPEQDSEARDSWEPENELAEERARARVVYLPD